MPCPVLILVAEVVILFIFSLLDAEHSAMEVSMRKNDVRRITTVIAGGVYQHESNLAQFFTHSSTESYKPHFNTLSRRGFKFEVQTVNGRLV